MKNHKTKFNITFLFGAVIAAGISSFFVLKPFVVAIVVAFILSQLLSGWHKKILKKIGKKRPSLAAGISTSIVFLVIFLPFVFVMILVYFEAKDLGQLIEENHLAEKASAYVKTVAYDNFNFSFSKEEIRSAAQTEEFSRGITTVTNLFVEVGRKTSQSAIHFFFMTFIMFFSLYYFFKDGDRMVKKFMKISPLKDSQEKLLLKKFNAVSMATLKGSLVIAIVQGVLIGILFYATGVYSAAMWGVVAVVISLIPAVGSVVVWLPAAIGMLATGHVWEGITIILVGTLVVSTIDNFLRPKLVGDATRLHPLLVLLSTLGGIAFFGIPGFLLGPIIVVFFLTLIDIYQLEFKSDLKRFND